MTVGYQAPTCKCGHKEGEHRSNRASFAGTLRFGPCLRDECTCREFVEDPRLEGGDRA